MNPKQYVEFHSLCQYIPLANNYRSGIVEIVRFTYCRVNGQVVLGRSECPGLWSVKQIIETGADCTKD